MTRSVRISWKTAQALLALPTTDGLTDPIERRALAELRAAMAPKCSVKFAVKRKAAKRKTKKQETAEIREAVFVRAEGRCECRCGRVFGLDPGEMDHFFPKGRTPQTVRTCWALASSCHRAKTKNFPDAGTWLRLFSAHCASHGYAAEMLKAQNRLEALELSRQSEARP